MKGFSTYKFIVTALTAGLLCSAGIKEAAAQAYVPTPVTMSTNKLKVDGKLCYSHIVQERQTIYSICKAYGVTADDLYQYNPGLKESGLKKNAIIIIPAVSASESKEEAPAPKEKEEAAVVSAPAQITPTAETQAPKKQTNTKHIKHTVKWYETDVKDIAEKYGVSVESIMQLNQLTSTTLTSRQKLLIPDPETQYISSEPIKPEQETIDTIIVDQPFEPIFSPKSEIAFGLLLPMEATGSSSKKNYMDFYSGVLMAVHDCAERGISTDLRVHDIAGNNLPGIQSLSGCDFVLGPVFKNNIVDLLKARTDSTVIISPLDHRAEHLLKEHNAFVQAPTERMEQFRDLVNWIGEEVTPQDRVIYIRETNARDTAAVRIMTRLLNDSGINYSTFSYNILQGRSITAPLLAKLTKEGTNRFIIESESEAWVNDVVRNINLLKKDADVVLYSPSKIRTFETIEAEYFHNISLRVSLSYNVNYDSETVRQFIMKYRALFMTEPTQFAYQGYDLATYFINIVHKYGDAWLTKITEEENNLLQSTFKFTKSGKGYQNIGVRRINYMPDGTISTIR